MNKSMILFWQQTHEVRSTSTYSLHNASW